MDWRLRGINPALWRRVTERAGKTDLKAIMIGLLAAYADGRIDPFSDRDTAQAARGALGGTARTSNMTAAERTALARKAAKTRWKDHEVEV